MRSLLLALLLSPPALAVELNGTIKGEVTDADGLPVPGASVLVKSADLIGGELLAETDELGRFRFNALPPGNYAVYVAHPAFSAWSAEELRLDVAGTLQLTVGLSGAEEVVVYAKTPAVNTEQVGTGATFEKKFLKGIPSSRDYQGVSSLAPGVVGGGNPNMHGSFDSSNQYYLDGVNTTDPLTNTFSTNLNWDAIESVQVLTGGMDAEYGRSLGGAVNVVTKSGGDEFEGGVTAVVQTPGMIIAPDLPGDSNSQNLSQSFNFNFGGPILKKKVWFYSSLQGDRDISTYSFDPVEIPRDTELYPVQPQNWRSTYLFGKITAQPSPRHRVWLQGQGDPTWIDNATQDPYTLPSAEERIYQGGHIFTLGHQFKPSNQVLLESQAYYQKSVINATPMAWDVCNEFDADGTCTEDLVGREYLGQPITETWFAYDPDGFTSGVLPYSNLNRRNRMSVQSALTVFFEAMGEHTFKTGLQLEGLRSWRKIPGLAANGETYYTHDGDPANLDGYTPALQVRYDNDWDATFWGYIGSYYVQDVWKPNDRLTVRPGLRFDYPILKDDLGATIFSQLTVSPRFGVAYDLTGDGRTRVGAYYGRFYDTGFLSISDLLRKGSSGYAAYAWDEEIGDWSTEESYAVAPTFLQHGDMRNPYSDEFNVTFSREIGPDLGFDANFIYEEAHNFWEDDEVNLIWDSTGTQVIGTRDGGGDTLYRLRTPDDVYTKYHSVELVARKSFSENLTFLGSYTWSRARGTNSADQATGVLDIAEQMPFSTGVLDYDTPHVVKFTGSYADPSVAQVGSGTMGYLLGWDQFLSSGSVYRKVIWNEYYQDYYGYDEPADGQYRLPMLAQTDLRAGLTLDTDQQSWLLAVDVFNVFNDRTVNAVNEAWDPDEPANVNPWGTAVSRQGPRNMQVILQGEF